MFNYQTLSTFFNRDTSLTRLVNSIWDSLDPEYVKASWLFNFFDIDTATGYWLDCWGVIVALPRGIKIPSNDWFGFYNSPFSPFDTFPFWDGSPDQNTIMMDDDLYRQAIKAKALANRSGRSVGDILAVLDLLGNRNYVYDNRDMTISIVVYTRLVPIEYQFLIVNDGLRLRPAAVGFNVELRGSE